MEGLSVANAELLAGEGGVASAPDMYDNGDALVALVGSNDPALLFGSTESDDSDLTAPDAPRRTRKKRRATYLRTKDEREKLQSEIDDLELRLAVLKKRAGIGGEAEPEQPVVLNSVLRSLVTQQQMAMAGVQSMVAKSLCEQSSNPLYSHVYLDKDWTSRRATMHALKSAKLQNGLQYLTERSRHLDPLVPYATTEMTQDAEGNVLCSDFEVIQFVGVKSVRQLYDATHFFFTNEEISLSERLGHLTIRDDYDKVDGAGINARMYSVDENGVMAEWNAVSFAECVDGDGVPPEQAYAVLATDCVDDDALYPYSSASRVRKDRSGAISLTVVKRPKSQLSAADGDEEFVVVMRAASICKLHRPPFPLSVGAKEGLVRGMLRWSDAMLDTIRSKLSTSGVVLK